MTLSFHVAATAARGQIQRAGLLASAPNPRWAKYAAGEQPGGVYVWDTLERAERYMRDFYRLVDGATIGWCDLWTVRTDNLPLVPDPILGQQGAHLVTVAVVTPDRLELLTRFEDLNLNAA